MDLATTAKHVAVALRLIGTYLPEDDKGLLGRFLIDCADDLDEAGGEEVVRAPRPAPAAKPEHKK